MFRKAKIFFIMCYILLRYKQKLDIFTGSLASTYVGVGRIASDEERFFLLKPLVRFSFTYGWASGLLHICLYINHQFHNLF